MRSGGPSLSRDRNEDIATMIDWNMLSPMYLRAVAEWAGAAMTVLAIGPEARRGP
jgi:hypothetical protein